MMRQPSVNPTPLTADWLLRHYKGSEPCELIAGELRMMSPAGGGHGRVAVEFAFLLKTYADKHDAGAVYAAETGFLIQRDPDTVRAPDAAFLKKDLVAQIEDESVFVPFSPTIAVEVISPHDRFSEVEEKAELWLTSGSEVVILADPKSRRLHVLTGQKNVLILSEADTLDLSAHLPDCRIAVRELFD